MGCHWTELPKPLNVFTTRDTVMKNLNTGKIIQHYSANTRLTMAQKCVTPKGTFYRTRSAKEHGLNWAFEAAALGLPNEVAPSAPTTLPPTNSIGMQKESLAKSSAEKQKPVQHIAHQTKDGGSEGLAKKIKQKLVKIFKK